MQRNVVPHWLQLQNSLKTWGPWQVASTRPCGMSLDKLYRETTPWNSWSERRRARRTFIYWLIPRSDPHCTVVLHERVNLPAPLGCTTQPLATTEEAWCSVPMSAQVSGGAETPGGWFGAIDVQRGWLDGAGSWGLWRQVTRGSHGSHQCIWYSSQRGCNQISTDTLCPRSWKLSRLLVPAGHGKGAADEKMLQTERTYLPKECPNAIYDLLIYCYPMGPWPFCG